MPTDDQDNPYRSPRVVEPGHKREGSFFRDGLPFLCALALTGLTAGLTCLLSEPAIGMLISIGILLLVVWAKLFRWQRLFGLPIPRITWVELLVCISIHGMLLALFCPPVPHHPRPRRAPPAPSVGADEATS